MAEITRNLENLRNLPTLPVVVRKLQEAIEDPNSDARQITGLIEDDPSMMARILRIANSAMFGGLEPIHSLQVGVTRLGFRAIANIALSTMVFSAYPKKGQSDFSRESFWKHCITLGIGANVVYGWCKGKLQHRYSKDVLHLAGLLHDIGKILLESFYHDEFMQAVKVSREKGIPLYQAEIEVLGADHMRLGAWLGQKWNLSSDILQVIRWHHDPSQADPGLQDLVNLVHTANYICNLEKLGDGGDTAAPAYDQSTWLHLKLSVADIAEIVDKVKEESKNSQVLMEFMDGV